MAKFLTAKGTIAKIEEIISTSKERLVLVSPFFQLSKTFFERLQDADRRRVKIMLFYGKKELEPDERDKVAQLKNLSLFFCENLHAKCYFNEDTMVITSMNMYEFSEKNREMGVLITKQEDPGIYNDAEREINSILGASTRVEDESLQGFQQAGRAPASDRTPASAVFPGDRLDAHCIRCGRNLPFDTLHALCADCYDVWAEYGDADYPEHYCHLCGKPSMTTKAKPLCTACYSKVMK